MEEDDINLVNFMEPKQAYEKFENELLELLPSDQQEFIAQLEGKGVINAEDREKMNATNHSDHKAFCTAVILENIEGSLTDSDEKFYALLDVMEKYKNGLDSLALKIKNHLDPIGTPFVCETIREYLWRNDSSLSNLPYNKMKYQLFANKIITSHEKQQIGFRRDEKSQMKEVIRIIESSLSSKQTRKFKHFLEIMEASDNQLLKRTAQKLGGSKRVPDIDNTKVTQIVIVLMPVGDSSIQCDGRNGGSYLWQGHDFGITLPPDCADGIVTISLKAYLPCSTQDHWLASPVFEITASVTKFKKPIVINVPHWLNIKSEADTKKLRFLFFQNSFCGVQKGSFEVGESFGSIQLSKVHLISIYKQNAAAYFYFTKAQLYTDQMLLSPKTADLSASALVNIEEVSTTEAPAEAIEKYLDLLILPTEGHDEKWGIYCIALDNPTYLQAVMKYFTNEHQIGSGIQVLKRQVIFESPGDDEATVDLHHIIDTHADASIIKILHNKKITQQRIRSLDLSLFGCTATEMVHEINFPMCYSLHIIGKLSPSSSKLKVDGLCGVNQESSEFSLASPTKHGYKFETYNRVVDPVIIKKPSQPQHLTVHKDGITETTITLSWKEPKPSDDPDIFIVAYEIQYRKGDEEFKKVEKNLTDFQEDLTHEVTGLVANTEYQFRVAAINAAGRGPFTDVVTQFTKPSQPKELIVLKITEAMITLSWKESNPSDVPIDGYEVQYRKSGEDIEFKKVKNIVKNLTCKVTGLVANTEYQFRVAAINTAGHGPFTDVVTQFTSFDYTSTTNKLKKQLNKLSKLKYDNMKTSLCDNGVITTEEQNTIDSKETSCEKMKYLIEKIIIPSLKQKFGTKYKSFLKAMEDSEDTDLQETAKTLGGSEGVPADITQTTRKRQHREESSDIESDNGIVKSKAAKITIQSTDLSRALSYACGSVSDKWNLTRLDSICLGDKKLDGSGTVIAILDTVIDNSYFTTKQKFSHIEVHDFLKNVPVSSRNHGTICSAVAVGSPYVTPSGVSIPRGVAPGAHLVVYRIADEGNCDTNTILNALEDIKQKASKGGIKVDVVSISYGLDEKDKAEIYRKVGELTDMGITFVAAAGNKGYYLPRACIPARFDNVISVGALDGNGKVTSYTPPVKLDAYAPGEYQGDEGTSYAAPAVAGLVLLLKQWADFIGIPKENINRVDILRNIFTEDMFVRSDSTKKLVDTSQPTVKDDDGTIRIFQPVDFFMNMKDHPEKLNEIVQEHLNQLDGTQKMEQ